MRRARARACATPLPLPYIVFLFFSFLDFPPLLFFLPAPSACLCPSRWLTCPSPSIYPALPSTRGAHILVQKAHVCEARERACGRERPPLSARHSSTPPDPPCPRRPKQKIFLSTRVPAREGCVLEVAHTHGACVAEAFVVLVVASPCPCAPGTGTSLFT